MSVVLCWSAQSLGFASELMTGRAGAVFDPFGAAEIASSIVFDVLLEPKRAARVLCSLISAHCLLCALIPALSAHCLLTHYCSLSAHSLLLTVCSLCPLSAHSLLLTVCSLITAHCLFITPIVCSLITAHCLLTHYSQCLLTD